MSELIVVVEPDEVSGFVARALGPSIVTEAETEAELRANIREAIEAHFDVPAELPRVVRLHFVCDEVMAL